LQFFFLFSLQQNGGGNNFCILRIFPVFSVHSLVQSAKRTASPYEILSFQGGFVAGAKKSVNFQKYSSYIQI
jgi:hypothetical protein